MISEKNIKKKTKNSTTTIILCLLGLVFYCITLFFYSQNNLNLSTPLKSLLICSLVALGFDQYQKPEIFHKNKKEILLALSFLFFASVFIIASPLFLTGYVVFIFVFCFLFWLSVSQHKLYFGSIPLILLIAITIIWGKFSNTLITHSFFIFTTAVPIVLLISRVISVYSSNSTFSRYSFLLIIVIVCFAAVLFSWISIVKHLNIQSSVGDLGIYEELIFNISTGDFSDFARYVRQHMHFDVIVFFIAPVYRIFGQSTEFLLTLQSIVLAGCAIPVYLIAKHELISDVAAFLLALTFLLFPPLHWVYHFDFHSSAFMPLPLLIAFYATRTKRWKIYTLFSILAMLCKEEVSLTISALGIYLFLNREYKAGFLTFLFGTIGFIFITSLLIPMIRGGEYYSVIAREYAAFGNSTSEVIANILTNPIKVFSVISIEQKAAYVAYLLIPLMFLPLFGRTSLIIAIPSLATALLASSEAPTLPNYHYVAAVIPWLIISSVFGIKHLTQLIQNKFPSVSLEFTALFVALCTFLSGAVTTFTPWSYNISRDKFIVQPKIQTLNRLISLVPDKAKVLSSNLIGPHLIPFKLVHTINIDSYINLDLKPQEIHQDFILLDIYEPKHPSGPGAKGILQRLLQADSPFGIKDYGEGFYLLSKNAPKDRNASVLKELSSNYFFTARDLPSKMKVPGVYNPEVDVANYLSFGPYINLPKGLYRVNFELQANSTHTTTTAVLDITANNFVIASLDVKGNDFRFGNAPKTWSFNFANISDKTVYEFRVYTSGSDKILLKSITLTPTKIEQPIKILSFKGKDFTSVSGTGDQIDTQKYADPQQHKAGFMATGPYINLPTGNYVAEFWLKLSDVPPHTHVATIDVSADTATHSLKPIFKELGSDDFSKNNEYQSFKIPFVLQKNQDSLEFRTLSTGKAQLWLSLVDIYIQEVGFGDE